MVGFSSFEYTMSLSIKLSIEVFYPSPCSLAYPKWVNVINHEEKETITKERIVINHEEKEVITKERIVINHEEKEVITKARIILDEGT